MRPCCWRVFGRGARRRRLVAQRTRHTLGRQAALALFLDGLFAAQRRLVGVEGLGGGFDGVEIHIGGDFGLVAIAAHYRAQDVVHPLGQQGFQASGVFELATGDGQFGQLLLIGEQVALLVHHGDLGLVQLGNAGSHQVDDGLHLAGFQVAPREQLQQYRGAGLALVAHEHGALGNGQVHAGRLDAVEAGDGAAQLAFQSPTVAGRLHELAGAQALVAIEDLEPDGIVARRHTGAGQLQARLGHVLGLDQQGPGVGLDGVIDAGHVEDVDHLADVHAVETAIQRTIVRLLRPEHHGKADGHAGGQADQQADLTQHGHFGKAFQEGEPQ